MTAEPCGCFTCRELIVRVLAQATNAIEVERVLSEPSLIDADDALGSRPLRPVTNDTPPRQEH